MHHHKALQQVILIKAFVAEIMKSNFDHLIVPKTGSLGLIEMTKLVLREEGVSGFYGGVAGVMIGQGWHRFKCDASCGSEIDIYNAHIFPCFFTGFIKAVAFSSNNWALAALVTGATPSLQTLCFASAFSGTFTH